MCSRLHHLLTIPALVAAFLFLACDRAETPLSPADHARPLADLSGDMVPSPDPSGTIATFSTTGTIDQTNPFFQSLGTNGRTCASCHVQTDGFGLSVATVQAVFAASAGSDPLFAAVDGANCPAVTAASGAAGHSLLLNNGLIRIGLTVPGTAEFSIQPVLDPHGCALVQSVVSVYRRPLPTTNLGFLSAVMFDGRETLYPLTSSETFLANLQADLAHQALDATLGHAQATTVPTTDQLTAIVNFELPLFTAQSVDNAAGVLSAQGASGGPKPLASQPYYPGINDPLGGNPTGATFNDTVFTAFAPWSSLQSAGTYTAARQSVARGEAIFNTHPLAITDVKGLNDVLGVSVINGTCTTCHDTPNVGNHSRPVPLDIGTSHAAAYETDPQIAAGLAQLSVPNLPIFQVTCSTGTAYTSDPGRALITGKCADVGRIKGPILRGLAARAPYFHNGAATSLAQVVAFYNRRFQMGLTTQNMADLVAFLRSL